MDHPSADRDFESASAPRGFERLVAELAAILIVAAGDALDEGIERALERIVRFYGADRSTVFRLVCAGGEVALGGSRAEPQDADMVATDSWAVEGVARVEGVFGSTAFPWALRRTLRGESIELDAVEGLPAEATVDLASCRALGILGVIVSPLIAEARVVGAIAIGQVRERRCWSEEEREQLATVAGLFASAVARRRAHQDLAEAHRRLDAAQARFRLAAATALQAQEDERRRVARELHDDVVQRLVSLSLSVELSDADASIADEARSIAETVHGLSRSLHPRLVESLGLGGAIEAETAAFAERFRGEVGLILGAETGEDRSGSGLHAVPPEVAAVVYRVLQEALRNVVKHAEAMRVEVGCRVDRGWLELCVDDDGCGFDALAEHVGLGLVSMRERMGLVGGELAFERSPLGGSRVLATIPVMGKVLPGATP